MMVAINPVNKRTATNSERLELTSQVLADAVER